MKFAKSTAFPGNPGAALAWAAILAGTTLLLACGGGGGSSSSGSGGSGGGGGGGTGTMTLAQCQATYPALGTPTAANEMPVIVDAGPCAPVSSGSSNYAQIGSANVPYTSVKICVPGTSTCQTIDHMLVDTGSTGVRIMASALNANMVLPTMSTVSTPAGTLTECLAFADGYTWGKVHTADVSLSGETAAGIRIQVIGDATAYTVPSSCTSSSTTALNDVSTFGANGVLGIGLFLQDCGAGCVNNNTPSSIYYSCTGTSCVDYGAGRAEQVVNPVATFTDNNGVSLNFPSVAPASAAVNLVGTLTFGIAGTVTAAVFTSDGGGDFDSSLLTISPALYSITKSTPYSNSFIDSGSNGIYLPGTGIATASTSNGGAPWFIPSSTLTLTGNMQSHDSLGSPIGSVSSPLTFDIANSTTLFGLDNGTGTVFNGLGAPNNSGPTSSTGGIDWGFPFFLGRTIYVGLESRTATISGATAAGPFWAY